MQGDGPLTVSRTPPISEDYYRCLADPDTGKWHHTPPWNYGNAWTRTTSVTKNFPTSDKIFIATAYAITSPCFPTTTSTWLGQLYFSERKT